MNGTYFMECVLLTEACYLASRKSHEKRVPLNSNNTPIHNTKEVQEHLSNLGFKSLYHPPDSSDLVSCDFFLFSAAKEDFLGQRFESVGERFLAAEAFLRGLSADFLQTVFWNRNEDSRYAVKLVENMLRI
jgi:hypothetical protein